MLTFSEKMHHFAQNVFEHAIERRDALLEAVEKDAREKVEEFRNSFYNEACKNTEKQEKLITAKAQAGLAELRLKLRSELILARETMLGDIFTEVTQKIIAFKKTPDYRAFLNKAVKDALTLLGEGEIVVYLDASDAAFGEDVRAAFPGVRVEILDGEDEIIGGCRALNRTKAKMADNTLAEGIEAQKREFLKQSGLIL